MSPKNVDSDPAKKASSRLAFLTFLFMLGFARIGCELHRIQVVESGDYAREQIRHSIRRARLPATRGRILDRNGAILADNKPSFAVAVYIEELRRPGVWENTVRRVDELLDELAYTINRERDVTRDDIRNHIRRRRAIPLLAFQGLTDAELARYAESPLAFAAGAGIYSGAERVYPNGDLACHIIGYTGRDLSKNNPVAQFENGVGGDGGETPNGGGSEENGAIDYEDWDIMENDAHTRDVNFYLPDLTGRDGVEKYFDAALAGVGGGKLIRVDAVGFRHDDNVTRQPVPGKDIVLTLDIELQKCAEESLGARRGAVVVDDLRNGDILAAATAPRFDLSRCTPRLPSEYFAELNDDPDRPLVNRAFSGIYPPGSVFKPVVALAALGAGKATENETIFCDGAYKMGNRLIHCTSRTHGALAMREALARSCNPFFITLGMRTGWEPELRDACARLGFGSAFSLGIPVGSGLLPSAEWKKNVRRESWTPGDTANLSIGQGSISATPLQIAFMTAAIALDGKTLKPRLIRDDGSGARDFPVFGGDMDWTKKDLAVVKAGMYDAVNTAYGTGRRAHVEGTETAAKTGTAEYTERDPVTKEILQKKHAWMICYAPASNPKYAFAVVAEDSDFGGITAAEILKPVLEKTLGNKLEE